MNPKIIYPIPERQRMFFRRLREIVRIVFICASLICLLVNFLVKGKFWSIIVVWSLFSLWRLIFSLRLVEFSVYSHAVRVTLHTIILLFLIDHFLAPGWAQTVIPIVFFADLLLMFVIYYVTYDRRHRHLVSILTLGLINLISIPYSIRSWPIDNWIAFAFQAASLLLFVVLIIISRKDLIYELKVRFMTGTK
ncbi:MAG: hypothetical protein IJU42_00970 [Erysipelotrichaceae bacterium]|nr:hypothetical protein [Erysipelotrichaceae bacterium]